MSLIKWLQSLGQINVVAYHHIIYNAYVWYYKWGAYVQTKYEIMSQELTARSEPGYANSLMQDTMLQYSMHTYCVNANEQCMYPYIQLTCSGVLK